MLKNKPQKGFTLIELLVVISIIALLSSIVLAALSSARAQARLAQKTSFIKQLVNGLELYKLDHDGLYPTPSSICASLPPCAAILTDGFHTPNSMSMGTPDNSFYSQIKNYFDYGSYKLNDSGDVIYPGLAYLCQGSPACSSYNLYWQQKGSCAASGALIGSSGVLAGSTVYMCRLSNP